MKIKFKSCCILSILSIITCLSLFFYYARKTQQNKIERSIYEFFGSYGLQDSISNIDVIEILQPSLSHNFSFVAKFDISNMDSFKVFKLPDLSDVVAHYKIEGIDMDDDFDWVSFYGRRHSHKAKGIYGLTLHIFDHVFKSIDVSGDVRISLRLKGSSLETTDIFIGSNSGFFIGELWYSHTSPGNNYYDIPVYSD